MRNEELGMRNRLPALPFPHGDTPKNTTVCEKYRLALARLNESACQLFHRTGRVCGIVEESFTR